MTLASTLRVNTFLLARSLAIEGAGIAFLPRHMLGRDELDELTTVLDEWTFGEGSISLVWPSSRQLAPRVRAFVNMAIEEGV